MEFHGAKPHAFAEAKCRICGRLTQYPHIGKGASAVAVAIEKILLLDKEHQFKTWLALVLCTHTSNLYKFSYNCDLISPCVPNLKEAWIQLLF